MQNAFRRHKARREYKILLRSFYSRGGGSPRRRNLFLSDLAAERAGRLAAAVEGRGDSIDRREKGFAYFCQVVLSFLLLSFSLAWISIGRYTPFLVIPLHCSVLGVWIINGARYILLLGFTMLCYLMPEAPSIRARGNFQFWFWTHGCSIGYGIGI